MLLFASRTERVEVGIYGAAATMVRHIRHVPRRYEKKHTRQDHHADLVDYRIKSYKALQNTGL